MPPESGGGGAGFGAGHGGGGGAWLAAAVRAVAVHVASHRGAGGSEAPCAGGAEGPPNGRGDPPLGAGAGLGARIALGASAAWRGPMPRLWLDGKRGAGVELKRWKAVTDTHRPAMKTIFKTIFFVVFGIPYFLFLVSIPIMFMLWMMYSIDYGSFRLGWLAATGQPFP